MGKLLRRSRSRWKNENKVDLNVEGGSVGTGVILLRQRSAAGSGQHGNEIRGMS
jgi:hypothetical protein